MKALRALVDCSVELRSHSAVRTLLSGLSPNPNTAVTCALKYHKITNNPCLFHVKMTISNYSVVQLESLYNLYFHLTAISLVNLGQSVPLLHVFWNRASAD